MTTSKFAAEFRASHVPHARRAPPVEQVSHPSGSKSLLDFGAYGITLPLVHPIVGPVYRLRLHAFGFGAYGIRTRDLLNAIEALYQLS